MEILETLKKVEKALDLRFEKDSSLYISKEDTEKIKEALSKSNFQNINAFSKKLGNRVVAKVIISNSWLVDFNKNRRYLTQIFDNIDKNFLKDISKDIVTDKIFSTIEFKSFIEGYYTQAISLNDCKYIYQDENKKLENRVIAFGRYLEEEYIPSNKILNSIRFIESEFKKFSILYTYIENKEPNFLVLTLKDIKDKNKIATWIIENKIIDKKDKIWHNLFLSLEAIAFDMSVDYISNNPSWDNKTTKHLIQKVLKSFSRNDNFEYKIAELYEKNYSIRKLFIHMLEPPKFKNKDLANSLLDYFESVGLPNNSEKNIEMIRNWKFKKGFSSAEDIVKNLQNINQDFTNIKTLNHYSTQLDTTDVNIILKLYENSKDEKKVVSIVSYYLVDFLKKRDIPKHFKSINSNECINQITEYIDKLNINTTHSKSFLEDNGKYELLAKLNQR